MIRSIPSVPARFLPGIGGWRQGGTPGLSGLSQGGSSAAVMDSWMCISQIISSIFFFFHMHLSCRPTFLFEWRKTSWTHAWADGPRSSFLEEKQDWICSNRFCYGLKEAVDREKDWSCPLLAWFARSGGGAKCVHAAAWDAAGTG
jgi:hypothetical protein